MSEPREFDVCGPLPDGITVLEASAGTGKTHTIATLAARYVAAGIALDRILLVSFTRMAAGELRERVRDRMVEIERGLREVAAGAETGDPVVALLAGEGPRAQENLAHAIASFDSATIVTTHSFCQEVLGGLGIAGDLEPEARFVEDLSDLATEVVDDLYVRKYREAARTTLRFDEAAAIARAAIETFTATIHEPPGGEYDECASLAFAARRELEQRKRRLGVMSYDDLVRRLRDALAGDAGEAARVLLCSRFTVALVDEFQDTDPAQWEILHEGFGQSGQTLVLIADPKQAIYAFRGADVYAYLDATRAASDQRTLPVNWRSDQALIDAHDALFANAQLGHSGIVYRRVRAQPDHAGSRLHGAPHPAAMRIRVATRDTEGLELSPSGKYAARPAARRFIADDLAADVAGLLGSEAQVAGRTVCPGDLAVLVRMHVQAEVVQAALQRAGVPAVINGAGSVFASEAARHWLRLIEALERPASIPRAHSAALTDFVGWSAQRLAAAADGAGDAADEWEDLHRRLHEWARILRTRGVASLLQEITTSETLPARLLADEDGERRLTDLRHIGQLLHGAATADALGPTALAGWLRARINEETGDEERTRRLESDDEAVQILTIHRSKGLEFPIVYAPFLWESRDYETKGPIAFHDRHGRFTLDVSPRGADRAAHERQGLAEDRGEDLRLAYVALTRARHQVVLWWTGSWDSRNAPLTRLLLARDDDGVVAPTAGRNPPEDATIVARLRALAEAAPPGTLAVERALPVAGAAWRPAPGSPAALDASRFERALDLGWRRTSYTDMTAASYEAQVGSEPEQPLVDDEPDAETPTPATALAAAPELSSPALLGEMPVGADVGTFVHRVLEAADFTAPDLSGELAARIAEVRARRAVDIGEPGVVADGLAAMIATPLGDVVGGIALCDVAREDRLDELGFELPLAGGERPHGRVTLDRIAEVLTAFLPADDPLAGYPARLADPFLRRAVRGYLTGSLDLVVRLRGADGGPDRFAVLDYKTNWLGEPGEPLTAYHYRPEALRAEMYRHHYALQALLYTAALHRFLRWRVPGYDPAVNLAGVAYLFVRGMTGGGGLDGSAPGVFAWRPPEGLPAALSDALDEGVAG